MAKWDHFNRLRIQYRKDFYIIPLNTKKTESYETSES